MKSKCNLKLRGCNLNVTFAVPSVVTSVTSVTFFYCIYRDVVLFVLSAKNRVTRLHRRELGVTKG